MTVHLWSGVHGIIKPRRYFQLHSEVIMNWDSIDKVMENYPDDAGLKPGEDRVSDWMLSLPGGLV